MMSFFPISVLVSNFVDLGSKQKSRPVSVLVSEKFCSIGLGLGRVGLDYTAVIIGYTCFRKVKEAKA